MPPRKKKAAYGVAAVVAAGTELRDSFKNTWRLGKDFAVGGFGRIYTAKQIAGKAVGTLAVVKLEPSENGPLFQETHVFQRVAKPDSLDAWRKAQGLTFLGLPAYLGSGLLDHKGGRQRFLLMPKFGASLESIREDLRPADVFKAAAALLDALHYLHDLNYVHADVKAENVLLPPSGSDCGRVVLVDFGLAKRLPETPNFAPNPKKAHDGTLIFTSLDAHHGASPSYRGDVEILGYNVVYWLAGHLPWDQLDNPPKVMEAKEAWKRNPEKELKKTLGDSPFLKDMVEFMKLAFGMDYARLPNYAKFKGFLASAAKKKGGSVASPKKATPRKASPKKRVNRKESSASEDDTETQPKVAPKKSASQILPPRTLPPKPKASRNSDSEDSESEEDSPPVKATPKKAAAKKPPPKRTASRKAARVESSEESEESDDSDGYSPEKPTTSRRGARRPPAKAKKERKASSGSESPVPALEHNDSISTAITASSRKAPGTARAIHKVGARQRGPGGARLSLSSEESFEEGGAASLRAAAAARVSAENRKRRSVSHEMDGDDGQLTEEVIPETPSPSPKVRKMRELNPPAEDVSPSVKRASNIIPGIVNYNRGKAAVASGLTRAPIAVQKALGKKKRVKVPMSETEVQTSPHLWDKRRGKL